MSRDLGTILDRLAELPRKTVQVSLDVGLVSRYEQVQQELESLGAGAASLAGPSEQAQALIAELDELRKQIEDAQEPFVLQALPPLAWSNLQGRIPERPTEDRPAYFAWQCELITACLVDPVATAEQVAMLAQRTSAGQWRELADAAIEVTNQSRHTVPFSLVASVLSRSSDEKSRQPAVSASPAPSSLADPPSSTPSSSATTKADSLAG